VGWSRAQAPVVLLQRGEELARLDDGVDAEFGSGAVRGAAVHHHVEPDETPMGDGEFEVARLGDDRSIRLETGGDLGRAEGGVLLVGDAGDEDVAPEPLPPRAVGGDHHRRHPALHVEGAAAVEPAVAHDRIECVALVARRRHRVVVSVEHQRAAAAAAAGNADDRGPAGMILDPVHLEAARGEPGGAEICDPALPGAAGNEIGIDGIDADEFRQKSDRVVAHRAISSGALPTMPA
jgi:hypothetical protein